MSSLDGVYSPLAAYPRYNSMAPCMRGCNDYVAYNGCDQSPCWCKKDNLDLRISYVTRCASSSCTYANMNTQTDVDILSGIQVQYCADHSYSPEGMAMPTFVEAQSTDSVASQTGTRSSSRTRTGSLPTATDSDSSPLSGGQSSNSLNTAAKSGIAIGAVFCVLLAILIIILLFRRRRQPAYYPPPPNSNSIPPQMAPTPFSGNGPFSPPLQQPVPIAPQQQAAFAPARPVSPLEEKTASNIAIMRKDVGSDVSPVQKSVQPAMPEGAREVHGDVPLPRHEVSNTGEITNTVTSRGMELDGSQHAQPRYQQSAQGYPYQLQQQGAQGHELDGGHNAWGGPQRQELSGGQNQWGQVRGQQYGGAYELGPGR
ncbi:hypothetical protein EJ04DRAFT_113689 [Polyplosphaeria fusca]|uniref:Extracellular membrane protein CFEM domain-containing protein n=1 Tax=Polyplosphaeria fusca TaxID=682080 RepID=A0A9P4V8Y5_9PLEO|nr:hypothetical protein EJ04DRAFT_113689 [Polyplosphaeria fusca]